MTPVKEQTAIEIISAHPTAAWVTVTPDLAGHWLEANTENRLLRQDHVDRLADDMRNGKWRGRNGEAIRFDVNGRLVDGQHRLWACIISQIPFQTLLVTGIAPGDYSTIGIGAKKSIGDFLGPVNHEKNTALLGAVLRLVYQWEHKRLSSKTPPSIAALHETLARHPDIRTSVNWAQNYDSLRKVFNLGYASLIHYVASQQGRRVQVESFLDRLADGVGLMPEDPVYHLRSFLLSQRGSQPGHRRAGTIYTLALAIKAWNMTKDGRTAKLLRFSAGEAFPEL